MQNNMDRNRRGQSGISQENNKSRSINIFVWLKRWESILEEVSKHNKEVKEFHFDDIEFWKWVHKWPKEEMGIIMKCCVQLNVVIKNGKEQRKHNSKPPEWYTCANLYEYAAEWKKNLSDIEYLLPKLGEGKHFTNVTQHHTTHVTKLSLKESQAWNVSRPQGQTSKTVGHIDIREWFKRWGLVMKHVHKESIAKQRSKFYFKELDFWKWVEEWQEEPMDFLVTCLRRCDCVMRHGNELLTKMHPSQKAYKHGKPEDLHRYAQEWREDVHDKRSMLKLFEDDCSSQSDVTHDRASSDWQQTNPRDVPGPHFERAKSWHPGGHPDVVEDQWKAKHGSKYRETQRDVTDPQLERAKSCQPRNNWSDGGLPDVAEDQLVNGYATDVKSESKYREAASADLQSAGNKQLLRTKSAYGHRQAPTNMDEEENLTKQYLDAIEHKDRLIAALREQNRCNAAEIEKLTSSLSKMMHQEISRDESSLENISIKNRPLKISEEYQMIQSNQWLEGKQAVDDYTSRIWTEQQRNEYLMAVMMESYRAAETMFKSQRVGLAELLDNPVQVQSKMPATKRREPKFTTELDQALSQYLKIQSQAVDFKEFAESLLLDLSSKFRDTENLKISTRLKDFCRTMCSLSWKMVVQTPPMSFEADEVGKPFDGSKHEPHWGSMKGEDPGVVILYYVCPSMSHGSEPLTKAKVMLGLPTSGTSRSSSSRSTKM